MFIPQAAIIPVFHHLPKVHRGLHPLVGRPIVAGIGSLNEHLSQWVDHQIQPLVIELPGYLSDTKQFFVRMQDIEGQLDNIRVTCDKFVFSIQHSLRLQATDYFLR